MALTDAQAAAVILAAGPQVDCTLAGTVARGDLIGYSSGWKRALATVGTAIQGRWVALEDGVSGQVIKVAKFAVIGGSRFAGGTAGATLYGAEGTDNGKYTETLPSTTGDCTTPVGHMLDATTAVVHIGNAPLTVAS